MTDTRSTANDGAAARLRDDIDRGRTGDKVDWPDPAAAPLGTDEEAAGVTPDSGAIEAARAAENHRPDRPLPARRVGAAWVLIGIVAISAVALLYWALT